MAGFELHDLSYGKRIVTHLAQEDVMPGFHCRCCSGAFAGCCNSRIDFNFL